MELHSPKFKGKATLDANATYDDENDLVPRKHVDLKANGFIVIKDVISSDPDVGIVGAHEYVQDTVPANIALTRCVTDTLNIRVLFECEPNRSEYTARVTINGQPTFLEAVPGNSRLYTGYCDLVIPEEDMVEIIAESSTGETYICEVVPKIGGPVITSAQIDSLPECQTHVKEGDKINVSGVIENTAIEVMVQAGGASAGVELLILGSENSGGEGYRSFSGEVTIGAVKSDAPVSIIGKTELGTATEVPYEVGPVPIDQQYPIIPQPTYTYPVGQMALKDGESVDIECLITEADSATYNVYAGMEITNPAVLEDTKTITLISGASQSFDNEYLVISASKSSNGSSNTAKFTVDIANAAPRINLAIVNNPEARLRTDADGNQYTVRLISDQPLIELPTLASSVGETGASWVAKSELMYETQIVVKDSDPRGDHLFEGLVATGLARVETNTIDGGANFSIAGFLLRELTVPALSQKVAIGTFVHNAAKVVAHYKDADLLAYRNDLENAQASFTVVNEDGTLNPQGNYLWISDEAFAGTNTSGTLKLTVEEL